MLNAKEICESSQMISTLLMGTSDLTKELMIVENKDRENLLYHLQHCLTIGRVYGLSKRIN